MANTIKLKNSGTSSNTPSSLEYGELAINYADGKLFYKDGGGSISEFANARASVSDAAPSSPSAGDIWFESDTGKTFIYYDDGTSQQWIEVGAASAAANGADGAVQFASGGTFSSDASNLYWDDTNNRLGIGTTSPGQALVVQGRIVANHTGNAFPLSVSSDQSTSGIILSDAGTTSNVVLRSSGDDFQVRTNSANRLTVDSSGNVGIGTTSPNSLLEVADGTNAELRLNDTGGTVGGSLNAKLALKGNGSAAGVLGFNNTASGILTLTNEDGPVYLQTKSNDSLLLRTNNNTRMAVTGTGDIGIGTSSPDTDLHVTSNANTLAHFESTDSEALIAFSDNSSTGNWYDRRLGVIGEQMVFITDNATRMTISNLGRVGIGNSSPDSQNGSEYLLDVVASSSGCINMDHATTSTTAGLIKGYSNVGGTNTLQFIIRADGDFESRTNSYGAISDAAIKQDIVDAPSQWDDIKAVQLRKYRLIDDVATNGDDALVQLGVVAQELEAAGLGGLVVDAAPDDDKPHKSVKYSVLLLKALGALQEAMARIEALEAN